MTGDVFPLWLLVSWSLPTFSWSLNNGFTTVMSPACWENNDRLETPCHGLCFESLANLHTQFKKYILPMHKWCSENWYYNIIFDLTTGYEKPSSPYSVVLYFWWGCRENLELITLGSDFLNPGLKSTTRASPRRLKMSVLATKLPSGNIPFFDFQLWVIINSQGQFQMLCFCRTKLNQVYWHYSTIMTQFGSKHRI